MRSRPSYRNGRWRCRCRRRLILLRIVRTGIRGTIKRAPCGRLMCGTLVITIVLLCLVIRFMIMSVIGERPRLWCGRLRRICRLQFRCRGGCRCRLMLMLLVRSAVVRPPAIRHMKRLTSVSTRCCVTWLCGRCGPGRRVVRTNRTIVANRRRNATLTLLPFRRTIRLVFPIGNWSMFICI